MAKKMKKKAPNPRKSVLKTPAEVALPQSTTHSEGIGNCDHYSRSKENLDKILVSIRNNLNSYVSCEHCRDEPDNTRSSKSKQIKKKGNAKNLESKKESNFIWVCLDCNRHFCSGEVNDLVPYNHARRHSKQEGHMWAVRSDDPLISWCYACSSSIPIEMPPDDIDLDTIKAATESESKIDESVALDSKGYVVRGLSNLGNTCFFNSVMQNLLASGMLCDYLLKLERSVGPITMTFKKLVVETRSVVDCKGVISPKGLFGAICAKASQFRGYQQQDSHELLRYLLGGLELEEINARKMEKDSSDEGDDGKADKKPAVSFVEEIFGGYTSSTVRCSDCGYTSIVQEQFLDLSLPLPSKKSPPKRVPPPPKRRPPLNYRNKGSNLKERVGVKESSMPQTCIEDNSNILSEDNSKSTVPEQKEDSLIIASEDNSTAAVPEKKEESSNTPSEGSESIVPEQKDVTVSLNVDDSSWMDFIDFSDNQCCNTEEVQESESFTQNGNGPQLEDDISRINESEPSFVQDSNTGKEPDITAEDISGTASCSQNVENTDTEFDGFGDLFNEPEVTSSPNNKKDAVEEFDLFSVGGDFHDEVDNSHAPVSVNSCLSLFTKPELLTGEQAWICEQCSKNAGLVKKKACKNGKSKNENPLSKNISGSSKEDNQIEVSTNSSGTSSQYYSCQPENEDSDNCSANGFESVECDQGSSGDVNQSIDSDGSKEAESEKYIKVKRDATKRILINRTPPILTIHLKRFRQDARGRFSKLSGYVSFQETLDLRPYMDPRSEDYKKGKCHYQLTGVVEHSGSMSGGHYISYVRGERSKSKSQKSISTGSAWFYCSDALVREVSLSEVLNSDAYILFFERVAA